MPSRPVRVGSNSQFFSFLPNNSNIGYFLRHLSLQGFKLDNVNIWIEKAYPTESDRKLEYALLSCTENTDCMNFEKQKENLKFFESGEKGTIKCDYDRAIPNDPLHKLVCEYSIFIRSDNSGRSGDGLT